MRIEYEVTLADRKQSQRFYYALPHVRRYIRDQIQIKAILTAFTAFIVVYLSNASFSKALIIAGCAFVLALLGFWAFGLRLRHLALVQQIAVWPAMSGIGKRTLVITDDTLTEGNDQIAVAVHWPLVKRITCDRRHLYFVLENESAFIVPLDTITPAGDRERFLNFLRRCAPPELRGELPEPDSREAVATASSALDCAG